jgi:hypothetical protein
MSPPTPDVFAQLLADVRLSEQDIAARLQLATNVHYWQELASAKPAASEIPSASKDSSNDGALDMALDELRRDGLCQLREGIGRGVMEGLNATIDAVLAAGWPAVFAFTLDELWEVARRAPIRQLVCQSLGRQACQIPRMWIHDVQPRAGAAGWPPHIDGIAPGRMSVWIAVTDATLDNGCMYAIPRTNGLAEVGRDFHENKLEHSQVRRMLHEARALPATSGDALAWMFDIIHWGGRVRRGAAAPRRSVALEFIAADQAPEVSEVPLVALDGPLPAFGERLKAISTAILAYRKFEPRLVRWQGLAERILRSGVDDPNGAER